MLTSRHGSLTKCVVVATVFLVGLGSSWVVFYGFSLLERDEIDHQNALVLIGNPSSETTISTVESGDLDELLKTSKRLPIRNIDEIVKLSGPLERNTVLLNVLNQADEDQVLDLLEQTQHLDPPARLQTQAFVIQRLVRINPLRAHAEVLKFRSPQVRYLLTELFREWVQFDLDSAISRAKTLSHADKHVALEVILKERSDLTITKRLEIAQQLGLEQFALEFIMPEITSEALKEPERSWSEIVEDAQNEPGQIKLLTEIAKIWIERAGLGALDRIRQSLDNSPTKSLITTAVLREVARTNPRIAFEYAMNLDNDPDNESKFAVVQKWAESDPHGVLHAISSMEQTGQYWLLLKRLIDTWSSYHPQTLLTDFDSLPSDVGEFAIKEAVSAIARSSPQEAAEIVSAMEDMKNDNLKLDAARSVFFLWSRGDMDSALDWILNDAGMKGLRSRLLTSAVFTLVNRDRDIERAMNIALVLPIGENEIGPEAVVVAQIASRHTETAIAYMSKVREGPTKSEAYSCLGYVLATKNMTARALKLLQQVPDYAKEPYLAQVLGGWAKYSPKRLFESLDDLPSKEIASTAAFSLLFYEPQYGQLSSEQIETVKTYLSEEDAKELERHN